MVQREWFWQNATKGEPWYGPPDHEQWAPLPNARAGVREADWLRAHMDEVASDALQPWVAILGNSIIARGSSLDEVYGELRERGVADALVAYVPARGEPRAHLIA